MTDKWQRSKMCRYAVSTGERLAVVTIDCPRYNWMADADLVVSRKTCENCADWREKDDGKDMRKLH